MQASKNNEDKRIYILNACEGGFMIEDELGNPLQFLPQDSPQPLMLSTTIIENLSQYDSSINQISKTHNFSFFSHQQSNQENNTNERTLDLLNEQSRQENPQRNDFEKSIEYLQHQSVELQKQQYQYNLNEEKDSRAHYYAFEQKKQIKKLFQNKKYSNLSSPLLSHESVKFHGIQIVICHGNYKIYQNKLQRSYLNSVLVIPFYDFKDNCYILNDLIDRLSFNLPYLFDVKLHAKNKKKYEEGEIVLFDAIIAMPYTFIFFVKTVDPNINDKQYQKNSFLKVLIDLVKYANQKEIKIMMMGQFTWGKLKQPQLGLLTFKGIFQGIRQLKKEQIQHLKQIKICLRQRKYFNLYSSILAQIRNEQLNKVY